MKIYLKELSENETDLSFTQETPWVLKAVERVDEATDDESNPLQDLRVDHAARATKPGTKPRPINVSFSLRKVDDVVMLSGKIAAQVSLICSRCAVPFQFNSRPAFSGLFCKDPVMAGVGHMGEEDRPSGQNSGFARHKHDFYADELVSQGKDLDITYLSNDYVDLSEVLTEHLQLQVPFQPLCREDCKGMCSQCGADQNVGRCACAKIVNSLAFSVLRDLKI